MNTENNITALSHPELVIARSAKRITFGNQNKLHDSLFLSAPIFGDLSEKQSQTKKHCAKNIVLDYITDF